MDAGKHAIRRGPDGNLSLLRITLSSRMPCASSSSQPIGERLGRFTQAGHAIVMSPSNQHSKSGANVCPLCQVTDVTMRYNQISHAAGHLARH